MSTMITPDVPQDTGLPVNLSQWGVYDNFDLSIGPDGDIYAGSEQGETGPARLQVDRNELGLTLELINQEQTNPELVKALGEGLYGALFLPSTLALWERTRSAAQDGRVRLRLNIEAGEFLTLPWELMHDGRGYLGLDPTTSIVRYIKTEEPPRSLVVDGPLRVLIIIACPSNFPGIMRDSLIQEMKSSFMQAQIEGRLDMQFLEHATYAGLIRLLRSREFHVLHFFGYSGINSVTGRPVLLFEDENGMARRLDADDLAALLYQEDMGRLLRHDQALRLVVLSDIEAEVRATRNYSCEAATTLVRAGIPSAIAMQYSLPVSASVVFTVEFYAAIAEGLPIDAAIVRGRKAICDKAAGEQDAASEPAVAGEWAAPVLLLHAKDGELLRPQQAQNLVFQASSARVFAEIETFRVQTSDGLTRFVLRYLPAFITLGVVLLATYWALTNQPDIMLITGVAVVLIEVWLLSTLFQRKLPDTLNALWRQRIIRARNQASLAREYLGFLTDYNHLLNHRRYVWVGRTIGLAIAAFSVADFKPVGAVAPGWMIPLRIVLLLFYLPAGWVIGTLLWKMIATVIVTTRLSYRFDIDVMPSHPDGCGGLKLLGDLYFEHVRIVLVAGLYVAGWVVALTLANAVMERHLQINRSAELAFVDATPNLCNTAGAGNSQGTSEPVPNFIVEYCGCLAQQPLTELRAERQQVLRCIWATGNFPPSPLIAAADNVLEFYRWRLFYVGLLVLLALVAVITFILPMYNTHRIMKFKASQFRGQAYSLAGEIADLERYTEQHGSTSINTSLEISRQLDWLEVRYRKYVNPPLWPFDAQVRFRFLGSLGTMALSWLLSEIVPFIISNIGP